MIKVNDNFRQLPQSYLFTEVGKKVTLFKDKHPEVELIRMDIGDITRPLFPTVVKSMLSAVEDQAVATTFHGYGPEQGYEFLRNEIAKKEYQERGIDIKPGDIFISDGAKSDLGNLGDIYSEGCRIAVMDPTYPVYVDDAVISGRGGTLKDGYWSNIIYLECDPSNGFLPKLPQSKPDVIYLCFPNNPTGVGISKKELKRWIDYAKSNGCIIIYDSAYNAFVRNPETVNSVYDVEGAEEVAIEVRSYSKTAGFTGIRCGYTVIPDGVKGLYSNGEVVRLKELWNRRQCTKFNGASYIAQKGAMALYREDGIKEIKEATDYYLKNAGLIKATLSEVGFVAYGGEDSPYVWASNKQYPDSWRLFDLLLEGCGVSSTPGSGFGPAGNGFIRLTGFNSYEKTEEAMERIKKFLS